MYRKPVAVVVLYVLPLKSGVEFSARLNAGWLNQSPPKSSIGFVNVAVKPFLVLQKGVKRGHRHTVVSLTENISVSSLLPA